MIIAVDFDGTIVEHNFPEIGKPIEAAFETLKQWQADGHKIVLWTCRNQTELYNGRDLLQEAVDFCEKQGFEFDAINCNSSAVNINPEPKIYADWYIDDRANYGFVKWSILNLALKHKVCSQT